MENEITIDEIAKQEEEAEARYQAEVLKDALAAYLMNNIGTKIKDTTLRQVAMTAVTTPFIDKQSQKDITTVEQKATAYAVFARLRNKDVLTRDDLDFVRERAGEILTIVAYGQLMEALDTLENTKE